MLFYDKVCRPSACPRLPSASLPLGHVQSRSYLPRLLTTLTPIAARDLLAAVPAGTGTTGATIKVSETDICGALASAGGSEAAFAVWHSRRVDLHVLVCVTVRDPVGLWA